MSWIKNKILTQQNHVRKLEFVEVSPKNKDKLLAKYKSAFEKDQKKYDELFQYEAKKVVHTLPRLSKEEAALLEALKTEAKPPPSPPPSPPSPPAVPCYVDTGSSWLVGYV